MPTLNPYTIIGGLLLCLAIAVSSFNYGHKTGVNAQKIADQQALDKVRADIDDNKRIANAKLQSSLNKIIVITTERDAIKTKLQQEHQKNAENTDRLHDAYAAYGLRFRAEPSGCGAGSTDPMPAKGNPASDHGPAICQLSDEATRSLRAIAYDADRLRDDYKLLYDWAHK